MPKQVAAKSAIHVKLGDKLRKAHAAHVEDEVIYSQFGELPPGIEGGIARLVDCKFDTYKKGDNTGEYFFYAAGVVVSPKTGPDGSVIEGLRTSIMEPIYDTPKRSRPTVDDHIAWVYNEIKKLDPHILDGAEAEDLESIVSALKEAQPYFKFRTWIGEATDAYPNPRTNHSWNGVCDYTPSEDTSVVQDNTATVNGEAAHEEETPPPKKTPNRVGGGKMAAWTKSAPTPAPTGKKAPAKKQQTPEPEEQEDAGDFDEFGDLDSLATAADGGDSDAAEKLTELALKAGAKRKAIDNADNWGEVAAMIAPPATEEEEEGSGEAEETEEESSGEEGGEEETYTPQVDDVVFYRPLVLNAKTKKQEPSKEAVECQITKVDEKAQTVQLKNLDTKKVYEKVPWGRLENGD